MRLTPFTVGYAAFDRQMAGICQHAGIDQRRRAAVVACWASVAGTDINAAGVQQRSFVEQLGAGECPAAAFRPIAASSKTNPAVIGERAADQKRGTGGAINTGISWPGFEVERAVIVAVVLTLTSAPFGLAVLPLSAIRVWALVKVPRRAKL